MIEIRPEATIVKAEGGWFTARWHFSFDRYYDPANVSFGDLRVFNDDRLIPGADWPMHPHRDIEGITYVAEGTFEHADSRGNGGVLHPGAVQRATLGSGMQHSERNHSKTEPMRFIQMWIMPAQLGLEPAVEQREVPEEERRDRIAPLIVPAHGYGSDGAPSATDGAAITVHQDATVYAGLLGPGVELEQPIRPGFGVFFFVVHGGAEVRPAIEEGASSPQGGTVDEGGDARIRDLSGIRVRAGDTGAEVLLVETRLS